jgi:hypothetical protein
MARKRRTKAPPENGVKIEVELETTGEPTSVWRRLWELLLSPKPEPKDKESSEERLND